MNPMELAKQDPSAFSSYSIEQIVAICGDGKLRDSSQSAEQLRRYLTVSDSDTLERHTNYCLDGKFEKSGFVLQDCVNEIGRRLGYEVKNGRYSGIQKESGFDGLWYDGKNYLIVEVETTDAYRINLRSL